jgi:hypothetical protein
MRLTFPRRRLTLLAALVAVGAAAVGTVAIAKPGATRSQADDAPKPVLIETALTVSESGPPVGRITRLFIGERSLCRRAAFEDEVTETSSGPTVTKRIDCGRRGDLAIRFKPRPVAERVLNQSASWSLIEATGSFRGLEGRGTMFVRLERREPSGREVFTGTLR